MAHRDHANIEARLEHLEKYDDEFRRKRKRLLAALTFRGFLSHMQVSVIIPSAWPYLKSFHSPKWSYAVLMSLTKLSCLLASPLIGRIYDKTKRVREITILLNTLEIVGSLLYSLSFSIWFLLIGRFISGIGIASHSVRNSETSWVTRKKDRVAEFAKQMFGILMGLLLGPPLSLLFKEIRVRIGSWVIDFRNAPGVFCALIWLIMQLLTLLLVTNVAKEYADVENDEVGLVEEDKDSGDGDASKLLLGTTSKPSGERGDNLQDSEAQLEEEEVDKDALSLLDVIREIVSPEIFVFYVTNLLACTFLLSSEVSIPLFTQEDLGWNTAETAAVYVAVAFLCAFILGALNKYGSRPSEIGCIIAGIGTVIVALGLWACYQYTRREKDIAAIVICIALGMGTFLFPLYEVAGKSLLSKVVPMRCQGVIQGAYLAFTMVGGIAGPLWAILFFNYIYVNVAVFITLFMGCLVWFLLCARKLEIRKTLYMYHENETSLTDEEEQ